jgi:hypothetical protein
MTDQQAQVTEIDLDELEQLLREADLSDGARAKLRAGVQMLRVLSCELDRKGVTIRRLRKLAFGVRSEKTRNVCGRSRDESQVSSSSSSSSSETTSDESASGTSRDNSSDTAAQQKPKRKGHGRTAATSYRGAERTAVPHSSLRPGDACPSCERGKLYTLPPARLVRIRGQAPISGHVYELERLRCNSCGELFKADSPAGVDDDKYDITTAVLIAVLRYGFGLPFHRLARMEQALGIPLPHSTQWQIVAARIAGPEAAYQELIRQAAQAPLVHNDDTYLRLLGPVRRLGDASVLADKSDPNTERTGTFTSGILAIQDGIRIALFFSGHQHAGENLADVLRRRAAGLDPPLQMCDGLSRNLPKEFETILCNCLSHARRSFVDVEPRFPDECRHVLETLRDVYHYDQLARRNSLSPEERLAWHQKHSAPLMTELEKWFKVQFKEKKVEPNSTLGDAIQYMQKHWHELTQFLRVAGAPLDNNAVERVLKRAIVHRKNSLFFRTQRGAHVGDVYMSLIHTCELCAANPVDYLRALIEHADQVAANADAWMPWNFHQALATAAAT